MAMIALRPDVTRAACVALVVGSLMVVINHGDHLAHEPVCRHFWLKLGCSYALPFVVSLVSSALALRAIRPR